MNEMVKKTIWVSWNSRGVATVLTVPPTNPVGWTQYEALIVPPPNLDGEVAYEDSETDSD